MTAPRHLVKLLTVLVLVLAAGALALYGDPRRTDSKESADRSAPGVRLRLPDGVASPDAFAGDPPIAQGDFFPVAVWFESVTSTEDVALDKAAGLNTYLELTTTSDLDLLRGTGMRAVASLHPQDPQLDGYLLPDEVDMWAGPGWDKPTGRWPGEDDGEVCATSDLGCGYSIVEDLMDTVPSNRFVYGQFGKGVMMWHSEAEAQGFVNPHPDAVSADLYWFTDPNICDQSEGGRFLGGGTDLAPAECRRPHNYGLTVDRMRRLVRPIGSKPVWVFVELGHPFTEDTAPTIAPAQVQRAVWSGLIHGARGVAYFNHNFGGNCVSQHVLRDACGQKVRGAVTELNRHIQRFAPVLNAPFVENLASSTQTLEVSAKLYRGAFYLVVGAKQDGPTTGTVRLACGGSPVPVDAFTNRRFVLRDGSFAVDFSRSTPVRIFRLVGGHTCGL